jgi:hypothetical protein
MRRSDRKWVAPIHDLPRLRIDRLESLNEPQPHRYLRRQEIIIQDNRRIGRTAFKQCQSAVKSRQDFQHAETRRYTGLINH